LIDALVAYQFARTELTAKKVADHLERVSLELFETVKTTGEVKPVFRLLYDGKPTPLLSFSESHPGRPGVVPAGAENEGIG
jgi:hypothetical protein